MVYELYEDDGGRYWVREGGQRVRCMGTQYDARRFATEFGRADRLATVRKNGEVVVPWEEWASREPTPRLVARIARALP